jgi:hypothetical protein
MIVCACLALAEEVVRTKIDHSMPQPLSIEGLFKLPGAEVLRRYHFSQIGNVMFYCGAVTAVLTFFPEWQKLSFQIESLIGMNLWRISKLPRWLATAVVPTALLGVIVKAAFPAVVNPVDSVAARATVVSRVLSGVMATVGGWRVQPQKGGVTPLRLFAGGWEHLLVLHLCWLPALSYYRWFSFLPQLRSFFYLTSSMDEVARELNPQTLFVMDMCCSWAERVVTLLRAHVVTRVLGEPVNGTPKAFMAQLVATTLACTSAFVVVSHCPTIPEIRIPWVGGKTLTSIRLERHMPLLQSLIQALLEQFFEKVVTQWIPLFPRAPPTKENFDTLLTDDEEQLVQRVQAIYGIKPEHQEIVERLATDAFSNPVIDASRRVAMSTIFWASAVISQRHQEIPKQNVLLQFKDQLRRANHEMEEEVLARQETIVGIAGQSGTFGPDTDLCSVCLSKIKSDQDLIEVVHCHHIFHTDCITSWLAKGTQCPVCRYDIAAQKEGTEVEAEQNAGDQSIERTVLENIDMLGFVVPHTYDYEEWGVVRKFCYDHNIACNAALSMFRDDLPVNQVTYYDLVIAPLLFMMDAYNMTMTFVRSDYVDYS